MTVTPAPGKTPPAIKDWQAIALLGVAVALFFSGILLGRAFLWEDFLTQVYPFRNFAAASLAGGELPLWNPYAYGGMPFQADIQSAVFYLPNLLLTLFVQGGRLPYYALEVMVIAHYWLAGVTMYYLAKELDLDPVYALFSALVFALSGFMIVRAIHPGFVEQAAWFPLIVLLFHRAMRRNSFRSAILGGLVLGHAVLAGAPQISLYIGFFIGLFWVFLFATAVRETGWRANRAKLGIIVTMVAMTVGVAAIQLLPTLELIPLSQRSSLSFATAQHGRLAWSQLLSVVIPKFQGAESARESTFWLNGEYGAFWETCFYMGIPGLLAIAMSATQIRANRLVAFFFGIVVLSLLLAVGDQFVLHRVFFTLVPGFGNFRAIVRIVILVTFCGAILAGFGMRAFVDLAARSPRKLERGLLGALAVIGLVCAIVWMNVFIPDVPQQVFWRMHAYSTDEAAWAMVLAAATCVTAAFLGRSKIRPVVALSALLLIQFADVYEFGHDQNNGFVSADDYYRKARERIQPLLIQQEQELFRVVTRRDRLALIDHNQGMVDRMHLIDGYTPLALQRRLPPAKDLEASLDLLNAKHRIAVDTVAKSMEFREVATHLPRAFVVHDARLIPDSLAIETFMRGDSFDPRRTVVVEEPPPFALSTPPNAADQAKIIQYRLNSIDIDADTREPGMLVLSEIYYPGWKAYVDGAPATVYRADWNLRAVAVPAGLHRVHMRFEAPPFRRGATITLVTLAIAAAVLIGSAIRQRRPAIA